MKVALMTETTHNPFNETHRVSCLRENLTSSSDGEGLETGRPVSLVPRQSLTRQTSLYHLKITLKMDVLKCETVDGVLKELAVFLLIYNLVRLVMIEAAQRQQVDINRVSFIDALRWLMHANPGDELVKLVVNPRRSTRYEPRVRKRRPKKYKLMNQPRAILKMKLAA